MEIETEYSKHDARCVWHKNKAVGINSIDCNCGAHARKTADTAALRAEYQRLLNQLDRREAKP